MLASAATASRQVDRLQAGLHLLHRLVAVIAPSELTNGSSLMSFQSFSAPARERVLDVDAIRAGGPRPPRVATLDALPAAVLAQSFSAVLLEVVVHGHCSHQMR